MAFDILQGDCIELARQLPDNCLDAVVSDPPAGIEFLGKEWDSFGYKRGRLENYNKPPGGVVTESEVEFKNMGQLPSFNQKVNARCESCGKYRWSSNPCECPSPRWAKDTAARDSFVAFMTEVAREALRTLKPGGYLIFWAIPRTSHWTAWALEEAGFEIKGVISHLYGSGFPKGLDIAKAMDKSSSYTPRGDSIYHVTSFIAAARDKAGMTNPEIDKALGFHGMAGHWTSQKSQPAVPTWENWLRLKELLKFGAEMDDEIQRLNGRKGQPGDEWFNRPILGWVEDGVQGHVFGAAGANPTYKVKYAITGNVTDAANEWEGWNTSLKPGSEFWIISQKPLEERNYANNILKYGVGAYNVKACAVPRADGDTAGWPSNVLVSHSPGCGVECADGCAVAELDRQSGHTEWHRTENPSAALRGHTEGWGSVQTNRGARGHSDSGGASRFFNNFAYGPEDLPSFFYCPKPTRVEKDAGCAEGGIEPRKMNRVNSGGLENDERWAPRVVYNDHPTVKSIALMRWLVRLVARKGATVADFFCGSGTTACAAILEGCNFVGFDLDARNVAISQARASYWQHRVQQTADGELPPLSLKSAIPATAKALKPKKPAPALTLDLFGDEEEVTA